MEQKNEQRSGLEAPGPDRAAMRTAEQMQENNATGAMNNEQGQASFVAGSTTGGGSNYGQGSSHLGSQSYRQGAEAGPGSNYLNEAEGLGRSDVGTNDEGTAAPAGATASRLQEGDRNSTDANEGVEQPRRRTAGSGRPPSGSWSQSSTERE